MDHYNHTIQTWDKLASLYQEKFMDRDLYDDTFDLFCQLVEKENPTIFEIACGPGNITRYLWNKRPDFNIEAIDVAPSMIELAKQNVPAADFKVMDCRDIGTLNTKYDAIVCGFCMPYLTKEDCITLIKNCAALLTPDGIFYLSTIEDKYEHSKYETSSNGEHTVFVYYHQEDYLRQALEENDIEVVKLERKSYPKPDGTDSTHIIFIARKK